MFLHLAVYTLLITSEIPRSKGNHLVISKVYKMYKVFNFGKRLCYIRVDLMSKEIQNCNDCWQNLLNYFSDSWFLKISSGRLINDFPDTMRLKCFNYNMKNLESAAQEHLSFNMLSEVFKCVIDLLRSSEACCFWRSMILGNKCLVFHSVSLVLYRGTLLVWTSPVQKSCNPDNKLLKLPDIWHSMQVVSELMRFHCTFCIRNF